MTIYPAYRLLVSLLGFSLLAATACSHGPDARSLEISAGFVLTGVHVVDPREGAIEKNMAVAVDGGTIVKVAPASSIRVTGDATRINLRGKYVVPGYNEMHAHPLQLKDPDRALALMLANGITGYRQMAGSPALLARRDEFENPGKLRPRLLSMPGAVLAPFTVPNAAAAKGVIEAQKEAGADFIKILDLHRDAFYAALTAARDAGLPVAGHVPATIDPRDSAAKGMNAIEHLGPRAVLLACSSEEEAIREALNSAPHGHLQLPPPGPKRAAAFRRLLANPVLFDSPQDFDALRRMIDTFDEAKCIALAKTLKQAGAWQTPTLIRMRTMQFGDAAEYVSDPHLIYVDEETRALWADVAKEFSTRISPEERQTLTDFFALQKRLVKLFLTQDTPMLAGSDQGGQWIVPGFGLHQEFDLLAEAGVSPLEILQMTTVNAAKFLHKEDSMGGVEEGKSADLVVLDANPLEDVEHLHRVRGVVVNGVYADDDALAELKSGLEP